MIAVITGLSSLAAATLIAGPTVIIRTPLPPPPPVMVTPPVVTLGVPDNYVWDGSEYVGVVGDQYYYLSPGNTWVLCDPGRMARFHEWARIHPDWRAHATLNMRFRLDAGGHEHPWTGDHRGR